MTKKMFSLKMYECFTRTHSYRMSLKGSGKTSLAYAWEAKQEMEKDNLEAAKSQLVKAEWSARKHLKEIEYPEEHYMQKEKDLTAMREISLAISKLEKQTNKE